MKIERKHFQINRSLWKTGVKDPRLRFKINVRLVTVILCNSVSFYRSSGVAAFVPDFGKLRLIWELLRLTVIDD